MSKHTDTRKAAELLRDRLQIDRQATDRKVAEEQQRLRQQIGQHATSAALGRLAADIRAGAVKKVDTEARDLMARAAACREIRGGLGDRQSLLLALPAAPADFIATDDDLLDSGKRVKLQIREIRALTATINRQRFEQRLTRYAPAALATLAAQAAASDDREAFAAIHCEIQARAATELGVSQARITIDTLATELPLPAHLQAEVEDLDAIIQAGREITQSLQALATGTELGTIAEASRQISEAETAGIPDAGAVVGHQRAARAMGRPVPTLDIPIARHESTSPDAA